MTTPNPHDPSAQIANLSIARMLVAFYDAARACGATDDVMRRAAATLLLGVVHDTHGNYEDAAALLRGTWERFEAARHAASATHQAVESLLR